MKIIVTGDFCPQNRVAELFEKRDFDTVLGEAKPVLENADYSIVNFECAVTSGDEKPIEKIGPNLQCSKRGVEAVKWAGFDCVTLANNHFYDFGDKGVDNTLAACKEYGIDTVGGGMNLQEASKVLYKEICGKTLAIINCCEHEFSIATDNSGGSNPLNPIQQYYTIRNAREHADYVLVIVHGGFEMFQLPSPRMQETYRFFIDAGADAVVNHHQHCFSGYEMHNGKPILYGLGNFCFDWDNQNPLWNIGCFACLHFGDYCEVRIIPFVQCRELPQLLLSNFDVDSFFQKIEEINSILLNSKLLKNEVDNYLRSVSKSYSLPFEPYRSRLMKALFRRNLVPSLVSKRLHLLLEDYVQCESHLEKLVYSLVNSNRR